MLVFSIIVIIAEWLRRKAVDSMAEIEEEKVAAIHLGQIPKQAERQNKFHFMFDLIRSDFSDTALEESFKIWQEEIIKKLSTHGLEHPVKLTGKSI